MKKNVGKIDRIFRFLIAALVVVLFMAHIIGGIIGIVLLVVAGIFILTSLMGACPLYAIFGINTCKIKKA